MPTKTFTLGKDNTVILVAPGGRQFDISIVTSFDAKQETHAIRVHPMNGPPRGADVPGGWNGSFKADRGNSAVDDAFAAMEESYWTKGVFEEWQIYQYILETNGSTSTYFFDGVTLKLSDAGSYKADSAVPQSIDFFASTRKRI